MTVLLAAVPAILSAQTASNESQPATAEVTALKAQLAEQQKQIDQLKLALEDQRKLIEKTLKPGTPEDKDTFAVPHKALGDVASTTPIIPAAPPIAATAAVLPPAAALPPNTGNAANAWQAQTSAANPCEANQEAQAPTFIRLGSTCLIPIGFMDLTAVWRDKNAASSLGTNFGSIPFNNAANGKLSEFRFTPQNSRIGFRFDGDWKGTHFIGYNEFDFLGTGGGTNYTTTNGAFVPRLRLYWVNVRKGRWEFLAGQSWSMLTPNRTGISALPGNLFYSQVVDVNYMAGLTWTRQPGMRVLYHPSNKVTIGFSAENPNQYIGNSGGGSTITLPSALAALAPTQLDNSPNIGTANTVLAVPTLHPDFIVKVAFDPSSKLHVDVTGLERTFKIINPNNLFLGQTNTKAAGGVQLGINGEVFKNFRLISTNYWSYGGGRYLFGQAPDLIVRADGTLSPIHSGGTVDGFEMRTWKNNLLLYAYYGGIYIQRNTAIDTNGAKVGYGVPGAVQNRALNEITFGFNQTIWGSARYGAVNLMGQYEWMNRQPWVASATGSGTPKATHDNTIYINIRYTLPGSIPNF